MVDADPESVLSALDPEQRLVALATHGPVCVLAGAGTGKTRAVAHRVAYAVLTGVVDPRHVLALTFTTRAAGELRARLHQLGGATGGLDRVQARTFHSAALRQLVHFWPQAVGGRPPAVLNSKISLLAEAARRLRASVGPPELRDVASEVEWAKVTQVRPGDYEQSARNAGRTPPVAAELVARIYAAYEELRRERHLVDFESVLELTAAILADHRPAAVAVSDQYRYFVVDEYQDVNPLQKLLLDMWAAERDDLCVVGDPRQTIYSFAGATSSYLTGFQAEFPDATVISLVRNYRSSPQIVALANQVATVGRPDLAPPLIAQAGAGPAPEFAEYSDDEQEAAAVAGRVLTLVADGTPLGQMAVLVRTNAQTLAFERAFAEAGVPCQVRGADRFFDRPEIRQATGLLKAAAKSARPDPPVAQPAGPAATRAMHSPKPVGTAGGGLAGEVRHILAGLGLTREPPAGRGVARERWESLEALAQLAEDFFADGSGDSVGFPESADSLESADSPESADLPEPAESHESADSRGSPGPGKSAGSADSMGAFVAELARRATIEHAPALDGVTLASLHAAKGLEWDAVFLPGLTDGTMPIVYAQTNEAIAEERRLLYVGITRARQRVFLSWALARSAGARGSRKPSRFLDGLRYPRSRFRAGSGGRKAPGSRLVPSDRYGAAVSARSVRSALGR
jgi:DNA helicase-2/ATP-dependent DNA helicase PcrA